MKKAVAVLPLVAVLIMGTGCARSAGGLGRVGTTGCNNIYFPLREGYRITYSNTYPDGSPTTYTMEVSSVENNKVILHTVFQSGTEATQELRCEDGVVKADSFMNIGGGRGIASAQTRGVLGDVMPRELRVGTTWDLRFDLTIPGMQSSSTARDLGDTDTTVTIHRLAIAEEDVTVPAGTFHAIKVQNDMDLGRTPVLGLSPSTPIRSYEWWVAGKGLVKVTTGVDQSIMSQATEVQTP